AAAFYLGDPGFGFQPSVKAGQEFRELVVRRFDAKRAIRLRNDPESDWVIAGTHIVTAIHKGHKAFLSAARVGGAAMRIIILSMRKGRSPGQGTPKAGSHACPRATGAWAATGWRGPLGRRHGRRMRLVPARCARQEKSPARAG